MARTRDRQVFVQVQKEIWQHFKSEELEIIGAYCYGFDNIEANPKQLIDPKLGTIGTEIKKLSKLRREQDTKFQRPWTTWERFIRAVSAIQQRMEENPMSNLHFAAAYLEANQTFDSGDIQFDPEDQTKSRENYMAIVGKSGFGWGDEKKLKQFYDGFGGDVCRDTLKFEPNPAGDDQYPPFSDGAGELSNLKYLGSLKSKEVKGNFQPAVEVTVPSMRTAPAPIAEEEVIKRKPGRPAKVE